MHSWHLFFATLENSSEQLYRILRTQSDRPSLLHCFYLLLSLSVLSFHCLFSITFTSIVTVDIIFLIMVTVPVYVNVSFITTITFTTTATVTFNATITVSIAITVSFTLFYSVTVPLLSLNFSHCPLGYYFHCFFHFYGYFICFTSLQISLLIFLSLHFLFKCLCHSPSSSLSHSRLFSLSLSWSFL